MPYAYGGVTLPLLLHRQGKHRFVCSLPSAKGIPLTDCVGNARLAGFEKDLGLTGYDYNVVLSVFYISYIIFEIPSNILCKWWGPGWFIPSISLGFGVTSLATAFVHTQAQVCAVRFLLGLFEAGVLPGIAYYLVR